MRRLSRTLAPLAAAALLACDPQDLAVIMEAHPAAPALVSGQPLYVALRISPRCEGLSRPVVEQVDGSPAPAWLTIRAARELTEGTYLDNPGDGPSFPANPARVCGYQAYPQETVRYDGWELRLEAPTGQGAAPVRLRVRVVGCGHEWVTELPLGAVAGTAPATFCGYTTGAACTADDDCVRAGWHWQVCTTRALQTWPAGESCYDPTCYTRTATPATCGCSEGVCAWR